MLGMLPESMSELGSSELGSLVDNMDYGLLRNQLATCHGQVSARHTCYLQRIQVCQSLIRIMLLLGQGDSVLCFERIKTLWQIIFKSDFNCEETVHVKMAVDSTECWSQSINGEEAQYIVWEVTLKLLAFCALCAIPSNQVQVLTVDKDATLASLRHSICSLLGTIRTMLYLDNTGDLYCTSNVEGSGEFDLFVKPIWLRMVSYVSVYLISLGSLAVNITSQSILGDIKKKKKKASKAAGGENEQTETATQSHLKNVGKCFAQLTGNMRCVM